MRTDFMFKVTVSSFLIEIAWQETRDHRPASNCSESHLSTSHFPSQVRAARSERLSVVASMQSFAARILLEDSEDGTLIILKVPC